MKGLLLIALILVALATTFGAVPKTYANQQGFDNNGNYTGFQGNNGYQQGQNDQAQRAQRDQLQRDDNRSSYGR